MRMKIGPVVLFTCQSIYYPIGPWTWKKICSPSCYEHDARVAEEGFMADLVCVFALGILDEEGCYV
jgi:hypothetical protein